MNSQERIKEMRQEDRQYGERLKGHKNTQRKIKNPKNLSRYNAQELLEMEEEDYLD